MDKAELARVLQEDGYRPTAYSLDGGLRDDTLCLDEVHGKWVVYYSERGQRWNEREFSSEDAACQYFLKLIRQDGAAKL